MLSIAQRSSARHGSAQRTWECRMEIDVILVRCASLNLVIQLTNSKVVYYNGILFNVHHTVNETNKNHLIFLWCLLKIQNENEKKKPNSMPICLLWFVCSFSFFFSPLDSTRPILTWFAFNCSLWNQIKSHFQKIENCLFMANSSTNYSLYEHQNHPNRIESHRTQSMWNSLFVLVFVFLLRLNFLCHVVPVCDVVGCDFIASNKSIKSVCITPTNWKWQQKCM